MAGRNGGRVILEDRRTGQEEETKRNGEEERWKEIRISCERRKR